MRTGIWFTNDLRTYDNKALKWSLDQDKPIIAFFIKQKETSEHRSQFIQESLEDLSLQLQNLSIPLFVFDFNEIKELKKLIHSYEINIITTAKAYNSQKKIWQQSIEKQFEKITFKYFAHETLLDLENFKISAQNMPDNFTAFRKLVESNWQVLNITPHSDKKNSDIKNLTDFQSFLINSEDQKKDQQQNQFSGGRKAALERLNHYLFLSEKILTYKITRNGLIDFDDSSKFSPWLAMGCLSAKEIYWAIKQFETEVESNESTYWLVFELLWRDYFKFLAEKYQDSFFHRGGLFNIGNFKNSLTDPNNEAFQIWKDGQTSEPFINANMIELSQTGWMSNRGRQNVANYLIKVMNVDWRLGAQWFAEQLIDYDVENNWGNWLYQSGLGTDPRDRVFNPQRQAQMYDPDQLYQNKWLNKN